MEDNTRYPFEGNILKVVAVFGLVRSFIALARDNPNIAGFADFYIDLANTIVFLLAIIMLQLKVGLKYLIVAFYLPIILLFCVGMVTHRGLASSFEINAFGYVVLFCLSLRHRLPLIFSTILIIGVSISIIIIEQEHQFLVDFSDYSTNQFSFIFVALAIIIITLYSKNIFDEKKLELKETSISLIQKGEELKLRNKELEQQKIELEKLRAGLEEKVTDRTRKLENQHDSMDKYLKLTLIELIDPYHKTLNAINKLDNSSDGKLNQMIVESGEQLKDEIEKLTSKIHGESS